MNLDRYSFCESVTATGSSLWCIRPLTDVGRKCGGGVDTASLCGRVRVRSGWDIAEPVTLSHVMLCSECKRLADTPKDKSDG